MICDTYKRKRFEKSLTEKYTEIPQHTKSDPLSQIDQIHLEKLIFHPQIQLISY